jgi:putative ATPase
MIPLAERMRPKTLEEWVGHRDILSPGKALYEAIRNDKLFSFILYAPPGSGKTSLCQIIKTQTKSKFVSLSATHAGVKDLKAVIEEAQIWRERQKRETILFVDEIHRFNKGQQDALLPAVERGEITLIGATTENPSFEVNSALLSRLRVFRLEALTKEDQLAILSRAAATLKDDGAIIEEDALVLVANLAQGDARAALNALEWALPEVTSKKIQELFEKRAIFHDRTGDLHHQVVSAFIKSMRASESDAALYYLARLWSAGEDPLYIARRMVIFASEDIGNADLRALALANAVRHAVEFVGRPECYYALAQGVIYLSKAAKSRDVGDAFQRALSQVERTGAVKVPEFITNANTKLDRDLGRGRSRREGESYLPLEVDELSE